MSEKKQYRCRACGEAVRLSKKPTFCPFCASKNITNDNEKARKHALDMVHEMETLIPSLEEAWQKYTEIHSEYERIRSKIVVYARRGVIDEKLIPRPNKECLNKQRKRDDVNGREN